MSNTDTYDPRRFLGDFKTDLWFPHYRQTVSGPWSVRLVGMIAAPGYWGTSYRISGAVVLTGPGEKGKASWMSTTPSEIESQQIGQAGAHGHTVVLGLGLGWQAANAALKPDVTHVTVVERDPAIIALIEDQGVLAQLPPEAQGKIEIVTADANFWKPAAPVDTLLADIWEKTDGDRRLEDYQRMQANIGAGSVYFWGQEVQIWRAACRRVGSDAVLDWPLVRAIVAEDFRLPLIVPDWPDYPQKIMAAAKQALSLMALMR